MDVFLHNYEEMEELKNTITWAIQGLIDWHEKKL
jgi:hypothetical protein